MVMIIQTERKKSYYFPENLLCIKCYINKTPIRPNNINCTELDVGLQLLTNIDLEVIKTYIRWFPAKIDIRKQNVIGRQ